MHIRSLFSSKKLYMAVPAMILCMSLFGNSAYAASDQDEFPEGMTEKEKQRAQMRIQEKNCLDNT